MKKIFWQMSTLILSAMLIFSFTKKEANLRQGNNDPVCITRDNDKPFKGIDAKLAFDMINNYKLKRYNNIKINDFYSGGEFRSDSRSVWFSLQKLKQFIYEIEINTKGKVCQSDKLGIRVYFAVYPSQDGKNWNVAYNKNLGGENGKLPKEYTNMQTLLMVPTIELDGHHTDFDYNFFDTAKCRPKLSIDKAYQSVLRGQGSESIMAKGGSMPFLSATNNNNTDLNHGTLKPPPYDDETAGARIKRPCNGTAFMNLVDNISCGDVRVVNIPDKKD